MEVVALCICINLLHRRNYRMGRLVLGFRCSRDYRKHRVYVAQRAKYSKEYSGNLTYGAYIQHFC